MKVLWSLSVVIEEAGEVMRQKAVSQVSWIKHLSRLIRQDVELVVCYPTNEVQMLVSGKGERITFYSIPRKSNNGFRYEKELTAYYKEILESVKPDVIHIWGTEFPNTWNMVQAALQCGMIDRAVVSIQGLVSKYVKHFYGELPYNVCHAYTIKDFLKHSNLYWYKKKMENRGAYEIRALEHVKNVIGRTDWDKASVWDINPECRYYYNSETMRPVFYRKKWDYSKCDKYRIFISQGGIPYKGMHFALEALWRLQKEFPQAELYVTGRSLLPGRPLKEQLRLGAYEKYLQKLIIKYGLQERVHFLGTLNEEQMCEQYLKANVFVLPSAIENSPNSLGEAMLLGTPSVSADVGGVKNLMQHETEGYIYQHDAPYMMAYYIRKVFTDTEEHLLQMSDASRRHAAALYDPEKNKQDLLAIYDRMIKQGYE